MPTREEILAAIKRTAKKNGGKPLGQGRLLKEAGIRYWDWIQHWSKYSDAVSAAGLTPNVRWTKYPEGVLEEKMVLLIRELRKDEYPTVNEMRLYCKNTNADFPFNAVKKRGRGFVRDLLRYCEKNEDYNDVLEICQAKLEELGENEKDDLTDGLSSSVGVVYLFKVGRYYKLGRSNDTVRRGKEIKLELPETPKLIHEFKTDDPSGVEVYWHNRFQNKRSKKSEFFDLKSQDVQAFKRWKKLY